MQAVEIQVSVSFDGVVDGVPICDFANPWAWIFGERVESQAVDGRCEHLV